MNTSEELRITAFADCGNESLVLRLPYEMALKMIASYPDCEDKTELMRKVEIASRRSKKMAKLLNDILK